MKLYFSPGACSLSVHIILEEISEHYDAIPVDLKTHKLKGSGDDFYKINPKGFVPVLEIQNGKRFTEAAVVLQFLGDWKPEKKLIAAFGTEHRYRCQEWLNFLATDVHKAFGNLFHLDHLVAKGECQDQLRASAEKVIAHRYDYLDRHFEENAYLMGDDFTVADPYLFTLLRWTSMTSYPLENWKNLHLFFDRIQQRPSTLKAMQKEGLLKAEVKHESASTTDPR